MVQEMISSLHLATTLLYDVLRRWSQYLNQRLAALASEVVEAPGGSVLFYLEPIRVDLEGGRYIGLILSISLADLVAGRRSAGGSASRSGCSDGGGSSGGGNKKPMPKVGAMGGLAQVRVRYESHLPSLFLWDGENSWSILAGAVLLNMHSHVLCNNWRLCGVCWDIQ